MDKKFSIIIPNYNNGEYLERCLNSILKQSYKNYEIIFIDDLSEDNSLEIASKMLKNHKIIKVPYKKYNGGARNLGIIEATGDYVVCIDSDDWLKDEFVLEDINKKLNNEDIMFLGFDQYKNGAYVAPFLPEYDNLTQALASDVCAIWTKVVKTDLLKDTLFCESTLAEDRCHHIRLCDKAKTFVCLKRITHSWNRSNSHSVSTIPLLNNDKQKKILWEASIYKHLGEMYYFINTTTNPAHREIAKRRFDRNINEVLKGIYNQV